jgi:transcriptional regulator with PAS, ATPase and Fis domain
MADEQSSVMAQNMEQAWLLFTKEGVIASSVVKPDIARSWRRCYKQKKDSGTVPQSVLKQRQKKNKVLIEVSKPVINDLVNMLKNHIPNFSVMLMDSDGVVNHRINYGNNIVTPGHQCNEKHYGTSGPALAIANGVGTEVTGYEHLYPNAHRWHTIGVPIRNKNKQTLGALAVLNPIGQCLPLTMQTVSLGAYLIESRLLRQELLLDVSSTIMDGLTQAAILANEAGIVLSVNKPCLHLFQTTPENLVGSALSKYLAGGHNPDLFSTSVQLDGSFYVPIKNNVSNSLNPNQICRVDRRIIQFEPENVLFMFTFTSMHKQLINKPAVKPDAFASLVGNNEAFLRVIDFARKAAGMASNVLIEGESGTGKELIAQAIHKQSGRQGRFIAINCGAIPKELLNSELFGYEDGAFTGAKKGGNAGKFELAHKGTLFLDEIGEMPLTMQVSLLRLLEDKTLTRLGGNDSRVFDVRIIAATNRNIMDEVKRGQFREDLFYRLSVVNLMMPPLRERKDDISLLAEFLLEQCCAKNNFGAMDFDEQIISILYDYAWPGNVRQLQNVIESSLIQASDGLITSDSLPAYLLEADNAVRSPRGGNLHEVEQAVIQETLERHNGNISQSARELGITRKTLYKKINQMAGS